MKIALLTHQWPGARMGGIGSAVRQIAASLALAGHETHVFTLTLPEDVRAQLCELPAGVIVHEVSSLAQRGLANPAIAAAGEGGYRLAMGWLLCDAMMVIHRRSPFDIVEAPEVDSLALPLLLNRSLAPQLPIVTHLHLCSAISDRTNDYSPQTSAEKLVRELEFAAVGLADGLCGPSQNVIDLTRELMLFNSKVEVIPYPFDAGDGAFVPASPSAELLFVGRIERRKGVMPLTYALNHFLSRNPDARFCFAGPDTSSAPGGGSMRQWILDHLDSQVTDRVSFAGELNPAQVRQALAHCRFCVLPSISENFSVALCETMAAGRTAVVYDETGSPEVIGDAGIVVPQDTVDELADAMERLYRDETKLDELSQRAYQRIRNLCDPIKVGKTRAAFYERVIKQRRVRTDSPALAGLSAVIGALTQVPLATERSTPGTRLLQIFQQIGAASTLMLYGAGKHTERLLAERDLWEWQGFKVIGLIDDHPRFTNNATHLGLPVIPLAKFAANCPVVLSTDTYQDLFWERTAPLRSAGGKVYPLYESAKRAA